MRLTILTQYYAPEIGAPQIRLRSLAKELRRHGIEVDVLTAMPNYPAGKIFPAYTRAWKRKEYIDGIPVRRTWIYAGTGKSAFIRLANYLSFTMTALFAALFGPRSDVIFVESQPLSLGLVALLMKWLRRVPYIYNVPDLQIDVAKQLGFIRNTAFLRLAQGLENFFLRHAWKLSTVTQRFITHYQNRGLSRDKITFLPNGADTEFLKPLPPCQDLLDRWKLENKKVFLYVGTHAYYHCLDTLIETATLLRNRLDIIFLMVGDGPERARLKKVVAERGLPNVIFGQSPYEEMDRLYSIAYASIATLCRMKVARDMRLSKIFPSLSCAVPVIYSGEGEAADLLTKHNCGIAVSPESPKELKNAIIDLAGDPVKREKMGHSGRKFVESEYSWSIIVDRWLQEIGYIESHHAPDDRKIEFQAQTRQVPF